MYNIFPTHGRPFGGSYWPEGQPRLVDTIEVLGSKWEIWEQMFCSGGSFSSPNYFLDVKELPKGSTIEDVSRCRSFGIPSQQRYEYWKWWIEHKGGTVEETIRREISRNYYQGILSKEGKYI